MAISLSIAFAFGGTSCSTQRSATDQNMPATTYPFVRMPDGKQWMTENLNVDIGGSYCYDDTEVNCRRYGRLYTWEAALRGCQSLGEEWRLPTDGEWREMAKHHGGVSDDSDDRGRAAYTALLIGGSSGFNALLGGNRDAEDGRYARLEAHGFYWTASQDGPASAPYYNFAKGGLALHHQSAGEKQLALSVRCVRGTRGAAFVGNVPPYYSSVRASLSLGEARNGNPASSLPLKPPHAMRRMGIQ